MEITKNRRSFLKLAGFLTVSSVGTLLAGCGGGDDNNSTGGNQALPTPEAGHTPKPAGTYNFPVGIASGDPRDTSVVLWTKVDAVSGVLPDEDLPVVVQVSSAPFDSPDFNASKVLVSVTVIAHRRYDHTVRHRIEGLDAGTHYWYRFVVDNDVSTQGRTKTAPAKDAETPLFFAYVSCQDWSANHWGGYQILGTDQYDKMDFFVHLGDYIYETAADATFQSGGTEPIHTVNALSPARLSGVTADGTRYALSLDDYRYLYSAYRSDPRIQAIHAKFPMIAIWDDHEFTDDAWKDHETYSNDNVEQFDRRRAANQAWFEYMPVTTDDVSFAPDRIDTYENINIYREFAFGKVMHLIMTDERLYRADHAIPEAEGEAALLQYLQRILTELGDTTSPNGLYQFIAKTKITFFGLEQILNDAINKATLPLGLTITGVDLKTLKPALVALLNPISPTPITEADTITVKQILTLLGQTDPQALLTMLSGKSGIGGLGSRYAALTEVLKKFVAQNAQSQYAMLGKQQSEWWASRMSAAQDRGAIWKIWGNEVCFLKMHLDVNRIRNKGLQLTGSLSLLSSAAVGLIGVLKYLLTNPDVRVGLTMPTDYTGDGSSNTPPGQDLTVFADSWDGYPDARDYLSSYLQSQNIKNVIAITGDLHTFIAGQVTDQASKQPVMLDFTGAGMSSNSFGGLLGSMLNGTASDNALVSGLSPLLTGRGTPSGMLSDLINGILTRPDKSNAGRDLFARLLLHFSDEVQWAEGVANGFVSVVVDTNKATLTYHNLRVERDESGRVIDPASYTQLSNLDSAYERRSSFTVYAAGSAASVEATASVWPAFPSRVVEYENPMAIPATETAASARQNIMRTQALPTSNPDRDKLRTGVQEFLQVNPNNPFAKVFLESISE